MLGTLSNTVRLDPTRRQETDLRLLGDRCSRLWNAANHLCRQRFIAKEGVPRQFALIDLVKTTPGYRQLPSDIAQELLKKLAEAWASYFELRARGPRTSRARSRAFQGIGRTGRRASGRSI